MVLPKTDPNLFFTGIHLLKMISIPNPAITANENVNTNNIRAGIRNMEKPGIKS
jgi:hypothetical protein